MTNQHPINMAKKDLIKGANGRNMIAWEEEEKAEVILHAPERVLKKLEGADEELRNEAAREAAHKAAVKIRKKQGLPEDGIITDGQQFAQCVQQVADAKKPKPSWLAQLFPTFSKLVSQ